MAHPFKSLSSPWPPTCSVNCLNCAMFMFVISLCLSFSDADTELDFELMTSAQIQYLSNSYKRHLALMGS